jgi:hypothetical protein
MSYSAETVPSSRASSHTILHLELEKEVVKILKDDNLDDLKRLTRFRLYQDDGLPGSILRDRPEVTLDTFLFILRLEAGHRGPHPDLDITQKVQEILRLLPQRPPSPNLSWDWKPEDAMYEVDIESIATDIDEASYLQLWQIPFEGWVRYAIGYSEASVERFFDQHRILRDKLSSFLSGSPDAFAKFSLVEKVNYILAHAQSYILIVYRSCRTEVPLHIGSFLTPCYRSLTVQLKIFHVLNSYSVHLGNYSRRIIESSQNYCNNLLSCRCALSSHTYARYRPTGGDFRRTLHSSDSYVAALFPT